MKHTLVLLLSIVLLAVTATSNGAVLTRLELVTDGSSKPPGDRLDVTVLFFPGEDEITIDLRAFAFLDMQETVKPVLSRQPDMADDDGRLLIHAVVRRQQSSRATRVSIVIPYASLKLPQGLHELAYEITGRRGGEVDFVKATNMAAVVVSNRTRTEMRQSRDIVRHVEKPTTRLAHVVANGRVTKRLVQIKTSAPMFQFQERAVDVRIPGEFSRPLLSKAPPDIEPPDEETAAAIPLPGHAWDSLAKFEPKRKRTIYYATNRAVVAPADKSPKRFGKTADTLTYGACTINIPIEHHRKGKLEVPGWWSARDPAKHFLVEAVQPLDIEAFREQTSANDVLLFVHGYNTSFKFAVLRTGQLVHDLAFPGQGVAFSWPSAGNLTGYFHDEKQAQASVPALVELFKTLRTDPAADSPPRKVHIIAHSMGNRVLLQAMRYYELEQGEPPADKLFGQVALAAPDVNGALFGALIPSLVRQADRVALYYCEADQALQASREVHKDKPVGLGPCFAEGVDTINAEAVNTEVIGHGYYASAHELLIDLRLYILNRLAPDERLPPLGERTIVLGFPHWSFQPP